MSALSPGISSPLAIVKLWMKKFAHTADIRASTALSIPIDQCIMDNIQCLLDLTPGSVFHAARYLEQAIDAVQRR